MIGPSGRYPGKQSAKRLAQLVAPVLVGATLVFLLAFVLAPKTAAVHPAASPLLGWDSPVITPISNTHTAPATTTVSITYDEDIDPATVSTQTFAVHAMQTGLLTQTYGVDDGTIRLTPIRAFKPGELVQASATTGTLNFSGEGPVSPTVWQFWTAVTGGSGVFTDSGQSLGISNTYGVALGDLDGDEHLDAFVANWGANKVWWNDGGGRFVDSGQSLGDSDSHAVALGDLDGDGDVDAFVANRYQANKVWYNNGKGDFIDSGQYLGNSDTWAVALGDADGDGDLDAFVANSNQANKLWQNDGSGVFTSTQVLGLSDSRAVALGDLDGDEDLDAFVANDNRNKVWLNRGDGTFYDSGQLAQPGHCTRRCRWRR